MKIWILSYLRPKTFYALFFFFLSLKESFRNPGCFQGTLCPACRFSGFLRMDVSFGEFLKSEPVHVFTIKNEPLHGPVQSRFNFCSSKLLKSLACCLSRTFVHNLESFAFLACASCWLRLQDGFDNSRHRCFRRCKSSPVCRCR